MLASTPAPIHHHRPMTLLSTDLLRAAERYVAAGVSIIPTGVSGDFAKRPHYDALKKTDHCYWDEGEQKWKATFMALRERLPHAEELRAWFEVHRAPGLAMVTGQISGLIALDFDGEAGAALLRQLGWDAHVRTPSGGFHVYCKHPGWPVATLNSKSKKTLPRGLDVRADGGLAMLPPTVAQTGAYERLSATRLLQRHHIPEVIEVDGQTYRLRELLGLDCAPEDRPEPPRAAAQAPVFAAPDRDGTHGAQHERIDYQILVEHALRMVDHRGRNDAGFWLCCQLRDNDFSREEALEIGPYWLSLLPLTNTKGSREAYLPAHFEASVRSAYRTVPAGRQSRPWIKGYGRSN